jgi:hypothetical protein
MTHSFTIDSLEKLPQAIQWAADLIMRGLAGGAVVLSVGREARSTMQNDKLWPMLTDISRQVEWFGRMHSPEVWKDLITGTFRKCDILPNLDSTGFVMTGLSTRKLSKPEFAQLIEYIYAFGSEKDVSWSEPALKAFELYRDAK